MSDKKPTADEIKNLPPVKAQDSTIKSAVIAATRLMVFAAAGAAILALTYFLTAPKIAAEELSTLQGRLNQVVPKALHDGDINQNFVTIRAPNYFQTDQAITVYRAIQNNKSTAAVFDLISHDGYSGDIRLLIGVNTDGAITGVRVVAHR